LAAAHDVLRAANGRGRIGCDDLADDEPIEQHAESGRSEKPIATPQSVNTTESGGPRGYDPSKKAFCFGYRPAARVKLCPTLPCRMSDSAW